MEDCPQCSGDAEPIKESAQSATFRCLDCGHVWTANPKAVRIKEVPLVVSEGERSEKTSIVVERSDEIALHDEFEHDGHRMLVTAIEHDGRYVKRCAAGDVTVLHAKVFDTVPLKISVNEKEITRSYSMEVEPEYEVHIGQVIELDGRRFAVKTLKSDQNRTLHKGFLLARNIRRAFCDEVKSRRNRVRTRPRGAPEGAKRRKR